MTALLRDLLKDLNGVVSGPADVAVTDIVFDSRRVTPGSLFVALKGVHHDGNQFIDSAIASGARVIVSETAISSTKVTHVRVPDALATLSPLGARFWDDPSRKLLMVGITGTNGKTTISYLVESIFNAAGLRPGVLGTINYRFESTVHPAPNTTPFASELQRFLGEVVNAGGRSCVMEVSSHALALDRVMDVEFDIGVFTNLTQDHLDFHKTMDAYAQAKAKLFTSLSHHARKAFPKCAVVNRDDPASALMIKECEVPVLGYGLKEPSDVFSSDLVCDASGSRFTLQSPSGSIAIHCPLLGEYNVMNALAAATVAISQTIPLEIIRKGLENVQGVPGRMERIMNNRRFTVVVDYAHTDDALRKVLSALRRLKPNRLMTVFGCGGDRDRTKRPLMGEASATLSDEVFLTSDNPRSEDPARIALDVETGIRRVRSSNYQVILDREQAIAAALREAREGDIVLIAGKGHEDYQILNDRTIAFDDREVACRYLALLGSSS